MSDSPFNILNSDIPSASKEVDPNSIDGDLTTRIESVINSNKIVLFMKGSEHFPQCGFSANTVAILKSLGSEFNTFDILKDPAIRQGLKEYSNWPTFPQLYFNGKLVGGNDIISEMHSNGELKSLIAG